MNVDPTSCREHLTALIAQEAGALERLAGLLEKEHDFLVKNDVDALESAMDKRQECVGDLARIEDERRSLCRMLAYEPDNAGLGRMLVWCDSAGTLKARWAECATRAARCRALNDRNGALVSARLKRVTTLLGALTGSTREARTYGANGNSTETRTGRVLTAHA